MPTLDTNIILRHLTADHPVHSPRARAFFQEVAAGARTAILREVVLVETVQILSSRRLYNLPRPKIADNLSELIRMPGIRLYPKRLYLRAFVLYAQHPQLSFVDSLLAAAAERGDGVVMGFDVEYRRVSFITRVEP